MYFIQHDSESKVLIIGEEFLGHLAEIKPELKHLEKVVVLGSSDEYEAFEDWVAAQPAEDPMVPASGSDVCFQLYTSGTTGLPKGVELTNDNVFSVLPIASKSLPPLLTQTPHGLHHRFLRAPAGHLPPQPFPAASGEK